MLCCHKPCRHTADTRCCTGAGRPQAELDTARVPQAWRDYCSHLLIPLNECRYASWFAPWKCKHERHLYEKCQYKVGHAPVGPWGLGGAAGGRWALARSIAAHAPSCRRPVMQDAVLLHRAGVQAAGSHLHRREAEGGRASVAGGHEPPRLWRTPPCRAETVPVSGRRRGPSWPCLPPTSPAPPGSLLVYAASGRLQTQVGQLPSSNEGPVQQRLRLQRPAGW